MRAFMKCLGETWRCACLYRAEKLEKLGVSGYQDSYIVEICKNPGVAQEQLAGLIYVHKSNVARQLASLEEKGFITRAADAQDKRSLLVYPTEKALAVLPHIKAVHREWNERVLEGMSEKERDAVASIAKLLSENAKRVLSEQTEGKR